jgi:spermidine synthase
MSSCYKDPRVTVHIGDGFKFLPEHKGEYDVIITDSSDPVGPAEALFQAPYFTLLNEALKEGGNISTQAESIWMHLPLIKELKETCKKTFPVAEWGFTTIPTCKSREVKAGLLLIRSDPAGSIGIMVCSKEKGRDVKLPLRAVPDTRYYNSDVHRGAFLAVPEFGRAMLEDGVNLLPKLTSRAPAPAKTSDQVSLPAPLPSISPDTITS